MLGLSVARGRLPGSRTLYGFAAASMSKLCMRCESPIPVSLGMNAGIQPPLGVMDTSQPFSSPAWMEVVPAQNASS